MSNINKRLLEAVDNSDMDEQLKILINGLLKIELRNYNNLKSRYGEDYDKLINELLEDKK